MEVLRFCLVFCTYYFLIVDKLSGFSCDYSECTCMEDMITCVDVAAPRFKFRATVTILYMDNVQILNLKELLNNLPNLRYLTLMNLRYFNCKWLRAVPGDITVRTNMCESKVSSTYATTVEDVSYQNDGKTKGLYKVLKIVPTEESTMNPVTSQDVSTQKEREKSTVPLITFSNSKFLSLMENTKYVIPQNNIRSDKKRWNKNEWWIGSLLSSLALVVLLLILIICLYKRNCHRGLAIRRQAMEDNSGIPLSQGLEEDNVYENDQ